MATCHIRLRDRSTGKIETVIIEANSTYEARQIAMKNYGYAYEIL